jgi:tRNA nucleotidyltransferase (CCA-adding enzyme)
MVVTMMTDIFLMAKPVIKRIENCGHQAYFVGGCVRDLLLNRPIGDIDIATSATPAFIRRIFSKVIPVGIEHGTVIVRHHQQSYEVTTFRIDGDYTDQRHPDSVEFIDQIDKDLERRDFTINALAMNKDGVITDLFNGRGDLQAKLIQTVGDGYERFTEDPLRMIRALRFSSQLGFTIHPDTLAAMNKVKPAIKGLAVERITNELTKLFAGEHLSIGISYLKDTKIYMYLPIFANYPGIISSLPKGLKPLHSFGEVIALLHFIEPSVSVTHWVKAWKCSNKTKQEANQLVHALEQYEKCGLNQWVVYQLSKTYYNGFTRLVNVFYPAQSFTIGMLERMLHCLPIQSKQELAINGNDLIDFFPHKPKGRWLQILLNHIEKEVVSGRLKNTKYDIKEWIQWNPPETN